LGPRRRLPNPQLCRSNIPCPAGANRVGLKGPLADERTARISGCRQWTACWRHSSRHGATMRWRTSEVPRLTAVAPTGSHGRASRVQRAWL
jgi:hypothetical protein